MNTNLPVTWAEAIAAGSSYSVGMWHWSETDRQALCRRLYSFLSYLTTNESCRLEFVRYNVSIARGVAKQIVRDQSSSHVTVKVWDAQSENSTSLSLTRSNAERCYWIIYFSMCPLLQAVFSLLAPITSHTKRLQKQIFNEQLNRPIHLLWPNQHPFSNEQRVVWGRTSTLFYTWVSVNFIKIPSNACLNAHRGLNC